jgi:hypothetical protein
MAKAAKKLEDFFGAGRRRCTLDRGELLKSKGNEKRMKLNVSMPMSNTNLSHCPEPFLTQFDVMHKQDAATNRARIDVEFDSMAVRIFSTDSLVEPVVSIQGALLHKFAMVGEGIGEKRTVTLEFLIYLPATKPLHDWEWDATHAEFFIESVKSQGSLDLSGEAAEEDEDEDEEISSGPVLTQPPPDKRIQVVPPASKSGPKQLAEYHAQQSDDSPKSHIEPPATARRKPGTRVN